MSYLITLAVAIITILSLVTGHNPLSSLFGKTKLSIVSAAFPKSANEVLVENLQNNLNGLEVFFSQEAPNLLQSKNITQSQKDNLQSAVKLFNDSKPLLSTLQEQIKSQPNLVKSIVEKVFNLALPSSTEQLGPTSIPPQCHLECSTK